MLIYKNANINQQDEQGFSSLHHAVATNNYEAAKILIQNEYIKIDVSQIFKIEISKKF
jgi:ankyrin repeat protein